MPGVLKSRNMNRRKFMKAAVATFALTTGFAQSKLVTTQPKPPKIRVPNYSYNNAIDPYGNVVRFSLETGRPVSELMKILPA